MDIQTSRFGRYVQALFNLKQSLTLGTALTDVMPTVNLEAPRPEMEVFGGNDLACGYSTATGAAGQLGNVALLNPTGSGKLLVVENVGAVTSVSQAVNIGFDSTTATGTPTTGIYRDMRRLIGSGGAAKSPVALMYARTALPAGAFGVFSQRYIPTTLIWAEFTDCAGVILTPGSGLSVRCGTVATTLGVTFKWRERTMEPTEAQVS